MTTFFMIIFGFGCLYCMYEYVNQQEVHEEELAMVRRQAYKEGFLSGLESQLVECGSQEFDMSEEQDMVDGIDFTMTNKINRKD